ncbi:hypothetical protein L1887_29010 [Cichorium endivia]|nr:hypothetical protein L1887_29010 [Cichorium endivia]
MERSRSSSRLRENVKTKFKNTSNTPLFVDDDDDFVSPPPGVNIAGIKEGVVDAAQKPKFTKSRASRKHQDQSKGMPVGVQKEVNKQLDSIQVEKVLDKRVNTGKTITASSGVSKGKTKVVDKSNTKKRKDAEKPSNKALIKEKSDMGNEGNPPVKRRKLGKNEGNNKVIEIGSSSKPSKKVKKDKKEDIDVDKKAYPPGLRTLSTRMTPGKVSLTMKTLSDVQKEALTYVYSVKVPLNNLKKGRPFINYVTSSQLDDIQKEEIKEKRLGMGEIEKRCSEKFDNSKAETDVEAFEKEYGNVEAYCAIVELGYNKIVSEKLNLEKALTDGLEKFPENGVLKEWLIKKKMLFNEGDLILDEDAQENEEYRNDVGINEEGDEGEKDQLTESHIAEHVQKSHGSRVGEEKTDEQMVDRDLCETPKAVGHGGCADIDATQFFEDPAVLEQLIDVLDKTSEKYYKSKVSGSGKLEGDVQNETFIGNEKRKVKVTEPFKSPFVKRVVLISEKLKKEEINFCNSIFTSDRDNNDDIWELDEGDRLTQGYSHCFEENVIIHSSVIDCWAGFLNRMELFKSDASPTRVFFDTNVVNVYLLDKNELEINRRRLFVDQMLLYLGNFEINAKFRDVGLVFFPIVARDNYYLLCFDLRKPSYYIIDHLQRKGNQQNSYGRVPQLVKDKVMLESEAYDNLDLWEKTIKLDEYAKSKKKKKPRRKA